MIRFLVVCLMVLLSGCCSLCPKRTPYAYTPTVASRLDSVIIHRLHAVPIPADTARVNALLECNSRGKVVAKMLQIEASENMRLLFKIDSLGNLLLKASRSVDTVFVQSDSVYITRNVVKTEYVEVPAKLKKWDVRFINIGKACILIVLGMLLYIVGRLFIGGKINIKLK
ncbi:hypothetical protein [Tannerella forsythia]|uniref:hypothetical protein n=1 Tax=Tannerella forsythia TaxID=28112 RepID=UPI0028E67CF3|nr:hypothetical protein [Tannerella forsythia]